MKSMKGKEWYLKAVRPQEEMSLFRNLDLEREARDIEFQE
jgi:hypothetical protein